ncbi:hypothetical protein PHYBOEH_011310 [Phytophthora boehmeriae]|uniref:Uncharacterized protein n=1 Tax=Phytophthora boehmeriae TaxID=109152 RepID=A0A8T1WXH4_9STRA|nr:hypothetical protein PHYBOEH_011310 [Phytophthora boehmeriae]
MTSGWHSAASSPPSLSSNRSISQDLLVMEKKRKAKEEAVKDLNSALLDETLAGLRAKAQQLQNDKWMYNDVQL